MRATTQDAFEAYVAELIRYREWTDGRKAVYGEGRHPMEYWSNSDYERITQWNASLKLARQVLGLTDEEDAEADHRAGIAATANQVG